MPLDHFSIVVPEAKLEGLVSWLTAANAVFKFKEHMRPAPHVVGLGEEFPYFWISSDAQMEATASQVQLWRKQHIAFTANSADEVKQWYEAAMAAGGEDLGKPGPRPEYHPGYYAAFVRDPVCGFNFEAVCHCYDPSA